MFSFSKSSFFGKTTQNAILNFLNINFGFQNRKMLLTEVRFCFLFDIFSFVYLTKVIFLSLAIDI
jgi:hypothetical protein